VRRGSAAVLGLILVSLATALQMFVDWHQESVSQQIDPIVKAGILGAGFLSLLAVLLGLSAARR
jgi:hypothetical protein